MDQLLEQFRRQYKIIQEHRVKRDAPVDTMGTGALVYPEEPNTKRFAMLISTMLSSQTQDHQTASAMKNLLDAGLSVDMVCETDENTLGEWISGVRFANRKKGFLKRIGQIIKEEHGGCVPQSEKALCALPGVGPKMAIVVLEHGFGELVGIGVDTHVHRVANRLGWANSTKTEGTRKDLERFIPKEEWEDLSVTLIGFGQQYCKGGSPRCESCHLANECHHPAQKAAEGK